MTETYNSSLKVNITWPKHTDIFDTLKPPWKSNSKQHAFKSGLKVVKTQRAKVQLGHRQTRNTYSIVILL